jgi:hypothetical protein
VAVTVAAVLSFVIIARVAAVQSCAVVVVRSCAITDRLHRA